MLTAVKIGLVRILITPFYGSCSLAFLLGLLRKAGPEGKGASRVSTSSCFDSCRISGLYINNVT